MSEPTEAQIKEFWEWCGFSLDGEYWKHSKGWYFDSLSEGFTREGNFYSRTLPHLDLNNLFKYAVPIARKYLNSQSEIDGIDTVKYPFHDFMKRWVYAIAIKGEDPALALFWALWQVKEKV